MAQFNFLSKRGDHVTGGPILDVRHGAEKRSRMFLPTPGGTQAFKMKMKYYAL
jgi:hypothetical protein